jgi:predicted transcriptional regulator YdeE
VRVNRHFRQAKDFASSIDLKLVCDERSMDPVMTKRNPFTILGVQAQVKRASETAELFAGIWTQFESHGREIELLSIGRHYFGVHFPTDKEDVTDYLAGMRVPDESPVPAGLHKRTVSGGQFAAFECPVQAIGESYRHIFTVWLPDAQVAFDPAVPVFEEYPEKGSDEPIRIYIPVRQGT